MFLKYLKTHFFSITLIVLVILAVGASYVRFLVAYDYIVYDEVECDPYAESCFIYCEDDECEEPFYYVEMERIAADLMKYCGGNNLDCEASYWCQEGEETCSITYCDPGTDAELCENLTESDRPNEELTEDVNEGI